MNEPTLPTELEAALHHLQQAVDARVAAVQAQAAAVAPAPIAQDDNSDLLEDLQGRLAAAEAEVERLQEALDTADSKRGQALKKVDDATAQVDDLLSLLEPRSEAG